jgi:hypothetical protein
MSTFAIVGIVATGLFLLVAVAVAMQAMEKSSKEKRRLHSGLTGRARNFQYMLDGFPDGFLNRDLQVLVCKCLLQVYEQLVQFEPKNREHKIKADKIKALLNQVLAKSASNRRVTLTDTTQIQEVQKLLNSLFNFISKMTASKKISNKEGLAYAKQIRRLMVQTSVDALMQAKNQAVDDGKTRLAIHYLQMAIEKMSKENDDGFFTSSISNCNDQINAFNADALKKEEDATQRKKESAKEWDELNKDDDSWKKKAIYD